MGPSWLPGLEGLGWIESLLACSRDLKAAQIRMGTTSL
jgi:hypothetical protein